jgi:aminomethyltransferase
LTSTVLETIKYYHFDIGTVAGIEEVIISNTGYTGSGGFELYVQAPHATRLWKTLMEHGEKYKILPCGLGARDTLRLEKGFCLYGNDINDSTSPIEAGLGWITKFTEPFVNSEYHLRLKEEGTKRKLVGFEMIDRGIPRQHYPVCTGDGTHIGEVTSGTQSPSLGKAIGLAYVHKNYSSQNTEIFIEIRSKLLKAKVVKIPFL